MSAQWTWAACWKQGAPRQAGQEPLVWLHDEKQPALGLAVVPLAHGSALQLDQLLVPNAALKVKPLQALLLLHFDLPLLWLQPPFLVLQGP